MRRPGAGPSVSTLGDLVRLRALREPDRVAYRFLGDGETESASLTCGELDRAVEEVAGWLQGLGLQGRRLLLLHPPGLEFVAAFFGCLRAGAVAVPAYPPDPARLARTLPPLQAIARDADVAAALTTAEVAALAPSILGEVPRLGSMRWLATDRAPAGARCRPASDADGLALLQYTSGSTAAPKGVMLSHRNLLGNSEQIRECFAHTPESAGVSWLPPYHDMGLIGGIIQPLYAGFPVVLMSPLAFLERPLRWPRAISAFGATSSAGPNFAYDLCARRADHPEIDGLDLSMWRVAINGAEPVRTDTMDRFAAAFAPAGFRRDAFRPCYGLAEATLLVTGGASNAVAGGSGRPAPGVELAIVDPERRTRCGEGAVGEVWVRGNGVGLGYWGRSAESEATFAALLGDGGPGPYLRTGDLGLLSGGELRVTGRLKDLVIVRGRKLHAEDVERTVEASHPSLRRGCGAVFAVDERLVAVHEAGPGTDPGAALDAIAQAVARAHETPLHAVVLVPPRAIPRTANGKIQRAACRARFLDGSLERLAGRTFPVAPEVGAVGCVRGEVARLLGVAPSALAGDVALAALGVDSLGLVELRGRLEARHGVRLSLRRLLRSGIAELDALAGEQARQVGAPGGPTRPRGRPLSPSQRAIWYAHQLDPGQGAYNLALAYRLSPGVDARALGRAIDAVAGRHPILRAAFPERQGRPGRVTRARPGPGLRCVHAGGLDDDELGRVLADEAHRPFDVERGPLVRTTLFTRPAGDPVLLLAAHHLVMDLRSAAILLEELDSLYGSVDLPPPTGRDDRSESDGEADWAYWREALAGAPPALALRTDHPRPRILGHAAVADRFELGPALVGCLRRLAAVHCATLPMALMAGFQALLRECGAGDDLVVGCAASGRTRPGLERVVGCLVNPLPVRLRTAGDPPFPRLLAVARDAMLGALEHQDLPFPLLVERLVATRDPARTPLFQAMLAVDLPSPVPPRRLGARPLPIERRTVVYDLELTVTEAGDGLAATLAGRAELFERATVARMGRRLRALLESAAA